MTTTITDVWYRGMTYDLVLTCLLNGVVFDLGLASAIRLTVDTYPGSDNPIITATIGTGITPRAQTGDNIGKADVEITIPETDRSRGYVWLDVVATISGEDHVVIPPRCYEIRNTNER